MINQYVVDYRTIYRGEDRELVLRVINSDGTPYSLQGVTEIKAHFRNSDQTTLEKLYSNNSILILDAILGKLTIKLTSLDTINLLIGDKQDFTLYITKPTGTRIVTFKAALTVEKPIL